jgi:predicted DCC family thiol-disulfide oxidoreductase YuxK
MTHLVFYDGECGLCDHAVQFILKHDKKKIFVFAPLQGKTASSYLKPIPPLDTMVLIENYPDNPRIYKRSQAAFRTLWLIGGFWTIPGLLYFLPKAFFDWGYNLVARNRHTLFSTSCPLPSKGEKKRFLE